MQIFAFLYFSVLLAFNSSIDSEQVKTETFIFSSNGVKYEGKIFLPASIEENKNLPAIFLIDFTEQHFKVATDEFEKVIDGVQKLNDQDALVVSLKEIADIDAEPDNFQEHYDIYKNMALYVDGTYTNNPTRTFIGKGSECGVVIKAMFIENTDNKVFDSFIATDPSGLYATEIIRIIEENDFPKNKSNKKLHFSFSTSNDKIKCNKIISLFENAGYPWLQFESVEYTKSNYENTYPVSYAEGIKFVFEN